MKKFFKKISLVLAFALVLGSADHATVAKAADTWKFQSAAETLYLGSQTVGADTFDFNFSNAPAGYTTSNRFDWSSSDTKVATVAAGGIVTAKADGKTTITCRISNKTTGLLTATASATVTVRTITHATKVEIYNAADSTKTPITSAKLVVGETIDLNRQLTNAAGVVSAAGQATNTASTDKTAFKTSDEKIATVDASTGVVTAKKAGTVVITAYTYDVTDANKTPIKTATCTITVAADASYTVKQTAVDQFTLTFENDITFDDAKLEVLQIFEQDGIKEEVKQYIKEAKVDTNNSKEVVVSLYFEFDDDATEYKVIYDGIEQHFVASIGTPVNVVVESTVGDGDQIYIYNNDIQPSYSNNLYVYPVDVNGIDLSSRYEGVSYNLETVAECASVSEGAADSKYDATIMLNEEAENGEAIVVTGSFAYDADSAPLEFTKIFYATTAPAQKINPSSVCGYMDDKSYAAGTSSNDWKTAKLEIALDDEDTKAQYLHVRLRDNYDMYSVSGENSNGTISFASSNPNVLLVDATSGQIKTVAIGGAVVIVYWTAPTTSTTARAKAVGVIPVTVKAKRVITKISRDDFKSNVISNTADNVENNANLITVKLTITDNYGKEIDVEDVSKLKAYTRDTSSQYSSESPVTFAKVAGKTGVYTGTIDGTQFSLGSVYAKNYSFVVTYDGKTYSSANFTVKVADPTQGADSVLVEATDVDVTVKSTDSTSLINESSSSKSTIKVYVTKNGVKIREVDVLYPYVSDSACKSILNSISDSVSTHTVYFYQVLSGNSPITELDETIATASDDNTFVCVTDGTSLGTISDAGIYLRQTLTPGSYTVKLWRAPNSGTDTQSVAVAKLGGSTATGTFQVKNSSGTLAIKESGSELKTALTELNKSEAIKTLFDFSFTEGKETTDIENAKNVRIENKSKVVGNYIYVESVTVTYVPNTLSKDAIQTTFTINKTYPVVSE